MPYNTCCPSCRVCIILQELQPTFPHFSCELTDMKYFILPVISVASDIFLLCDCLTKHTINMKTLENSQTWHLATISVLFYRNNTLRIPIQSRVVCELRLSHLFLQLLLRPSLCRFCYPTVFAPLSKKYFTPWAKCKEPNLQSTKTASAFHSAPGAHHSLSTHFPRQTGLESYKKEEEEESPVKFFHLVLFSFSASVFHLSIYLSFFSFFPLPPPSSPTSPFLLLCSMSFFIFCTFKPFSPLNCPPSPLLTLSFSLSGA